MLPPSRLENTEQTPTPGADTAAAAKFHGASYSDATLADWHKTNATERGGDPFSSLDHNFYPQSSQTGGRRDVQAAGGGIVAETKPESTTPQSTPTVESADGRQFAGAVPIRETMMSILNIADQLRSSDTLTPEQRNTLTSAINDFDNAKTACVDNGAVRELHFIDGVSSAVSTFVGRRGLAGAEGADKGTANVQDQGSAVLGRGNLLDASGTLQSGFLPGADGSIGFSPSPRRELADAQGLGGRTSESGPRIDNLGGMVSYRNGADGADPGSTSSDFSGERSRLDQSLDGSLSTGNGKRISMVSKGRAEDSSNLGMTS